MAALVLRDPVRPDGSLAVAARQRGVTVLGLAEGAAWAHVTTLLAAAVGDTAAAWAVRHHGVEIDDGGDLFTVANSLADLLDSPVTIESPALQILAFSSNQLDADPARQETVLGRQVPPRFLEHMRSIGFLQQLRDTRVPLFLPSIGKGVLPRIAMPVRAGGEFLGSIWTLADQPPNPRYATSLVEAARIVALHMLRTRELADTASRLRTRQVAALIDGGAEARHAAGQIGIPNGAVCVLAVALRDDSVDSPSSEVELRRTLAALDMHIMAAHPRAAAALVGRTIFAVVPLSGTVSRTAPRVRSLAVEFVDTMRSRVQVMIGVGEIVGDVAQLDRSRAGAETALRVLTSARARAASRSVATADDTQAEALLLQMADLVASDGAGIAGPLAVLVAHDRQRHTTLVDSLRAWLDAFGDVAAAADALHVHANTLRYRIRRLTELTGIDLADPDTRLGLMLQLRLYAAALA